MSQELYFEYQDTEYEFTYISHTRAIARAIVFDNDCNFYFVRNERDDEFGKCATIETAGGGIEENETPEQAILRELKEELGVEVIIIKKIGVVSDYYNLLHRHNINDYFLCKITSFSNKNLTEEEINCFHLSTLCLNYNEALKEYTRCANSPLGKLIYQREIPILKSIDPLLDY